MAVTIQKLLDRLVECQEDLSRARQEAERIYCEADKLFRPWSDGSTGTSVVKGQESVECRSCTTEQVADEFVAQEEIDLEALDKALAMAERAREIQAQHKTMQRQRKALKQSKASQTSVTTASAGQKESASVKATASRVDRTAASKSKPQIRQMLDMTAKTRMSGVTKTAEKTRKSLHVEADCQRTRKPASSAGRQSGSRGSVKTPVVQAAVLEQTSIHSGKHGNDVMQQKLFRKIKPETVSDHSSREENVHRQKRGQQQSVGNGQSKAFLLLRDGRELKMPASYRSAVVLSERLLEELTESCDRHALSAAHFIERLEQTFDMKKEAHLQDDHMTDLTSQIPVPCDVMTYSHFQELDQFLSLQCKQLIIRLDSFICQIVLRDILPCLTEAVPGDERGVLAIRCALQLMKPGMKMLPRAHVTESKISPDHKQAQT